MAGVAETVLAEHEMVADLAHVLAVAHELQVPGAVHGIAVQHGANQLVIFDDQFFVNMTGGIFEYQIFTVIITDKVTGWKQIDTGDFQLGWGNAAHITSDTHLR